jgi:hypothetical protein
MRKIVKRVADAEKGIEKIETEISEMDIVLSDPSHLLSSDEGFFNRYIDLKKSLNDKMALWGKYTSELEELKKMNNGPAAI